MLTFETKTAQERMEQELLPAEFLSRSSEGLIIDVRTPSEFSLGHIPGAVNIPLFTDAERADVGTIYLHKGKDAAVEKGLYYVGPKLSGFVVEAKQLSAGRPIFVHCWRGGMRSASMVWLFRTAGLSAWQLQGGYKAYRQSFIDLLQSPWKLLVLGGPTGCGKTDILQALQAAGEQVLDLEALACHKGSAFGAMGQGKQPSTAQFINNLHAVFRKFTPNRRVWCEGESLTIGKVCLPQELFTQMLSAPFIYFSLPKAVRIQRLLQEYGTFPTDMLAMAFRKIERRLGSEQTAQAIQLLNAGDVAAAAAIALRYYDKCYTNAIKGQWQLAYTFCAEHDNAQETALELLRLITKEQQITK